MVWRSFTPLPLAAPLLSPLQVLSFAGELLANAEPLLRDGLHPTEIADGYAKAGARALEILDTLVVPGTGGRRMLHNAPASQAASTPVLWCRCLAAAGCRLEMPSSTAAITPPLLPTPPLARHPTCPP